MEDGYMKTWQQCCDYFNVNTERGLSPDQVKKNLDKYGPNGKCVKEKNPISYKKAQYNSENSIDLIFI